MRHIHLQHRFVEFIPEILEEGILYISLEYMTVTHLCCCGCGNEVSLPLSPVGWRLIYDGRAISLEPSIGSWSLPCRSHYWIRGNRVQWAEQWSTERVQVARELDRRERDTHFSPADRDGPSRILPSTAPRSRWVKIKALFGLR